ncbi:MAG: hypothetical protein QGG09_01290 [Pirellulaceae bacterium]|nr:hypothetical protein [Pirellulaceae bacterium]
MARISLLVAVFAGCCVATLAADSSDKNPLAVLKSKLIGTWEGQGPCDGSIIFESNGTYKRLLYGPGGNNSSGKWTLSWDALPPTLTLACEQSDDPGYVGRALPRKLVQLDDATFAIKYKDGPAAVVPPRSRSTTPTNSLVRSKGWVCGDWKHLPTRCLASQLPGCPA